MSLLGDARLGAPELGGVVFRVDYFAVTFHGATFDEVTEKLGESLGPEWGAEHWSDVRQDDRRMFKVMGPFDAYLEQDRKLGYVHVSLKGRPCGQVGTERLLELAQASRAWLGKHFVARRIDVAWDDYGKRMSPSEFEAKLWCPGGDQLAPGVKSRAHKGCLHSNRGGARGGCCELGTRKSLRMLRYYDKEAQSQGAVRAMRLELQTRNRMADRLLLDMERASSAADAVVAAASHLVAYVDFKERDNPKTRAWWWEDWVGSVSGAVIGGKPENSLVQYLTQVLNQLPGPFSVLAKACGSPEKAAAALVGRFEGKPKNPRHKRRIEQLESRDVSNQERLDLAALGILC